jgi:hypothetical protein
MRMLIPGFGVSSQELCQRKTVCGRAARSLCTSARAVRRLRASSTIHSFSASRNRDANIGGGRVSAVSRNERGRECSLPQDVLIEDRPELRRKTLPGWADGIMHAARHADKNTPVQDRSPNLAVGATDPCASPGRPPAWRAAPFACATDSRIDRIRPTVRSRSLRR